MLEQFPDINKLCNVASCWIYEYIGILLGARPILHISRLKVNITVLGRRDLDSILYIWTDRGLVKLLYTYQNFSGRWLYRMSCTYSWVRLVQAGYFYT
jgi:hypothetical protein